MGAHQSFSFVTSRQYKVKVQVCVCVCLCGCIVFVVYLGPSEGLETALLFYRQTNSLWSAITLQYHTLFVAPAAGYGAPVAG